MTADTITAIKKALEGVNAAFLRVLSEAPTDAAHYSIGLDLEGSAIRITLADMRAIAAILSTLESLQRENEELREDNEKLAAEVELFAAQSALSSTGGTHGN